MGRQRVRSIGPAVERKDSQPGSSKQHGSRGTGAASADDDGVVMGTAWFDAHLNVLTQWEISVAIARPALTPPMKMG
jgi:hypothetical protein